MQIMDPSSAGFMSSVTGGGGPPVVFLPAPADDTLARWNGRVKCKGTRRHGIAPVHRSHPAYRFM